MAYTYLNHLEPTDHQLATLTLTLNDATSYLLVVDPGVEDATSNVECC